MPVPHLACMALVAQFYGLPPRVLPSIQTVEGGRPGLVSRNTNGTEDLGVMQINTIWLPVLARHGELPEAEVRGRLLGDVCYNIAAAGLILRTYLDETGGDLMRAVGNYHSHTPFRHQAYRARVIDAAWALFGPRAPGARSVSPGDAVPGRAGPRPRAEAGRRAAFNPTGRSRLGHLSDR